MYLFGCAGSQLWQVGSLVAARMGDIVPWAGMEPRPPALGAQSLNHCAIMEVPISNIF